MQNSDKLNNIKKGNRCLLEWPEILRMDEPRGSIFQGCKSFRFSLISDFFIKSSIKGARANLKTTF